MKKILIPLILLGIVIFILVAGVFFLFNRNGLDNELIGSGETSVIWDYDMNIGEWKSNATPPACPDPVMDPPTDLTKVSGMLYPGQYRGDDYKPHGGFHFDNNPSNEVSVTTPMDSYLVKANKYSQEGETQYYLFFINNCGIMYKMDHLLTLAPKFAAIASKIQEEHEINRYSPGFDSVFVKKGEPIASEVGFRNFEGRRNVFFDFGVYDLRQKNEISKDPSWASRHKGEEEYSFNGVCFYKYFSKANEDLAASLPAGGIEGKVSDYCN